MTEKLLFEHPDMCGLFVSGGGITGALGALREAKIQRDFVSIGYELIEATRKGLIDGTLTMAIAHPLAAMAHRTIDALTRAKAADGTGVSPSTTLGFEIYTSENI